MATTYKVLVVRINCENEATQSREQLAELLRQAAEKIEVYGRYGKLMDENGNTVGSIALERVTV